MPLSNRDLHVLIYLIMVHFSIVGFDPKASAFARKNRKFLFFGNQNIKVIYLFMKYNQL
jgi:hypothetical protein